MTSCSAATRLGRSTTATSSGKKRVVMAYNEHLADGVRQLLAGGSPVTEQAMFGRLAFLVAGNIAVASSIHGGLLFRGDPAPARRILETPIARPIDRQEP